MEASNVRVRNRRGTSATLDNRTKMIRLSGFEDRDSYRGGLLSIGNFDGVHRGHQAIAGRLVDQARAQGTKAVVLTFEPHPATLLVPGKAPPRLATAARKAELLGQLGVDVVIEYPTNRELLELTPEEFFERIVLTEIQARGMVEGPNFFFGKDRAGDVRLLAELCRQAGLSFESLTMTESQGETVSSSAIRRHLLNGQVADAARMLGRLYGVEGIVTSGAGRGRDLEFATANLSQILTLLPAAGVYAAIATCRGERWGAAVNLGPNPTFGDETLKVEAHLLGFSGDLYGRSLQLEFVERIRETRTFPSSTELQRQVRQDIEQCRMITSPLLKTETTVAVT